MKNIFILFATILFSLSSFGQGNGYLGISMKKATNEGVRISEVLENGAAKTHGLLQNDVILSVDGVKVNTASELKKNIVSKDWGETISLVFERNGHTQTKQVILGNKANKITYHVKRIKINSTYEWNFDEKVWVTMSNGKAVKMVKLKADNSKSVLTITDGMEIPQEFADLGDKIEIIDAINERNKGKKFYPTITVYIKTYTEQSKNRPVPNAALKVELKAFPNPSLGQLQFSFKAEESKSNSLVWQVIDISGKLVGEGNLATFEGTTTQQLDLTPQGAGVYLLKVVYENRVFTERLVVK